VRLESTLGEIVSVDSADMSAESLSLLLVDLADFKLFNDTHGHQAGDQVLRSVADMLRSCSRASDSAARLGGDEFALLLPHAGSNVAIEVAERLADLATTSGLRMRQNSEHTLSLTCHLFGVKASSSSNPRGKRHFGPRQHHFARLNSEF